MPAPRPDDAYEAFQREMDLLESAQRTGAPTQDADSEFFGLPNDEFVEALRELRDEIEQRAYLAIVAATEAVVQVDVRARVRARAGVPLHRAARKLDREERQGRRIVLEDVLECLGGRTACAKSKHDGASPEDLRRLAERSSKRVARS